MPRQLLLLVGLECEESESKSESESEECEECESKSDRGGGVPGIVGLVYGIDH